MQRRVMGLVKEGSRITGVKLERDEVHCDTVVLAMGAWSAESSGWLDFQVPVTYLKGERLMLRYDGEPLPVLISSPKRGHMISRRDGFLSVGSTRGRDYDRDDLFMGMEFDRQPSEKARMDIMGWATDVFPGLEEASLVEQLAGSRPLSPDRLPIIGPVPGTDGVMLATGHTTKGIHLSLVTGKAVADRIFRGSTDLPVDMTAFLPDRFINAPNPDFQASSQDVEE
jgi:glycine/D-amino acid oxidase-like deaminating enzyme